MTSSKLGKLMLRDARHNVIDIHTLIPSPKVPLEDQCELSTVFESEEIDGFNSNIDHGITQS